MKISRDLLTMQINVFMDSVSTDRKDSVCLVIQSCGSKFSLFKHTSINKKANFEHD